jgi:hypothetical protein
MMSCMYRKAYRGAVEVGRKQSSVEGGRHEDQPEVRPLLEHLPQDDNEDVAASHWRIFSSVTNTMASEATGAL